MPGRTLHFDGPGDYIIQTKEKIKPDIIALFSILEKQDKNVRTYNSCELVLSIRDQSELMGFLNLLFDHHYTLIKVAYTKLNDKNE